MSRTCRFQPTLGVVTLAGMAQAQPGKRYLYTGSELLAAQLKTIAAGQLLFDSSRFVGETGIVVPSADLGSARGAAIAAIKSGDERVAGYGLVALATLAAARLSHDRARPMEASTQIGAISPAIAASVVVAVVGVAAVCAGAYYAKEAYAEAVHVDGQIAKTLAAADAVATIGSAAVAAGQPIPKEVTDALRGLATTEQRQDSWWPLFASGLAGLAGGLAIDKFTGKGSRR